MGRAVDRGLRGVPAAAASAGGVDGQFWWPRSSTSNRGDRVAGRGQWPGAGARPPTAARRVTGDGASSPWRHGPGPRGIRRAAQESGARQRNLIIRRPRAPGQVAADAIVEQGKPSCGNIGQAVIARQPGGGGGRSSAARRPPGSRGSGGQAGWSSQVDKSGSARPGCPETADENSRARG